MRPFSTPLPLKILILATLGLSLLSPLIGPYLALSASGVKNLFLWQFLTHAFFNPAPAGFSLSFFFILAFDMYLLWTFGASLLSRMRPVTFFALYFTSALVAGLSAYGAMTLFNLPFLYAGTTAPLYSVLIAWVLLNPNAELRLFFTIPFKACWLLLGLMVMNLLIDLSDHDWIGLFSATGAFLYGYLFSLIAFRSQSPYSFLKPFENTVHKTLEKLRHVGGKKSREFRPSKVYDIHSGNPVLGDEAFMDAMLARISLYGEETLTPEEKQRMRQISARKVKKKDL